MPRTRALFLVVAALALTTSSLVPTASAAATATCRNDTVPLRLAASSTSAVLTTSPSRATQAVSSGAADKGVVALVAAGAGPGRASVTRYRLTASGSTDYVYARDAAGRKAAVAAGYTADGETLHGAATPAPGCTRAVYQLVKGRSHQLAVGGAQVSALAKKGWVVQGPLLYAADPPGHARPLPTGPVARALPAADDDPVFRIAVLPDTQEEVHSEDDHRLLQRSEYIAAHAGSWDVRLAVSVGDIADWDTDDHAQYARAAQQLQPLVAKVPFVAVPGNHDTQAVCPGGSACTGLKARTTVRDTTVYNTYFPAARFSLLQGQYEPGKTDNAYHTFRAGGVSWLVLNLELWPREQVVDWAAAVVAANPHRNVIVVTHSYLTKRGKILGDNGGYGSMSPKYLFDHVVKRYPNVKIVLSGHTGKDKVRVDTGVYGNKIVSYLQCFHSRTANPFRRISVDTQRGRLDTAVYTPSTGKKSKTTRVKGMAYVR
ncbi:metallophosphoesterase [Microlunatus flavus]|uniref:3',5'-cyclic AMP phosphodiesterase CpdA n=1 Tax=Microlunatus flavus TaxID=1036181 RepID=A0A1H9EQG6_9ACTN|nr:metallophosphoesterase [Microlunatus flavus]SEQ27453.1 3',5'-cyclic AMP phosphodiesterase CpdA [Microlunatus flavus]